MPQLLPPRALMVLLCALLLPLGASALLRAAPGVPSGLPFLVSPAGGAYLNPDVALDAAGNALVVWHGEDSATPGSDVFARLFDPAGKPRGPATRVNAEAAGEQRRPAVAALPNQGFVVVWDTDTSRVWARLLDGDGAPTGADIAVNEAGKSFDADVAAGPDGAFVVAWEAAGAVALRRYSPEGAPLGVPAAAAPATGVIQMNPSLATTPGGAFALAWEELDEATYASSLRLRHFDAAGDPASKTLTVAESSAEELRDPVLSADSAGTLLVAWSTYSPDDGSQRIIARRLADVTLPLVGGTLLSDDGGGPQFSPALAVTTDGSAMIAWRSETSIAARRLDATGLPDGEPLAPRPADGGPHTMLAVAAAAGTSQGSALWVVWSESETSPQSGDTLSAIYARRYVAQIHQLALPLLGQ
jgi:hypothetical protein